MITEYPLGSAHLTSYIEFVVYKGYRFNTPISLTEVVVRVAALEAFNEVFS